MPGEGGVATIEGEVEEGNGDREAEAMMRGKETLCRRGYESRSEVLGDQMEIELPAENVMFKQVFKRLFFTK